MPTIIAIVLFLIFLFLSSLHFYWGFGGKWGSEVSVPATADNIKIMSPGPIPCFIVALGLLGFGLFVLVQVNIIHFELPAWLNTYGLWLIASIFFVRVIGDFKYIGLFKVVTHTRFAQMDKKYFSPLCLLLSLLIIGLALLR